MAAEPTHRLAQLPGFDTAPDVYETPDIDDSTTTASTFQTSSPRSASDESETSDEDDEGVSRRRLYPERARSRFTEEARGVVTRGADLSDRVDGKRRGYRVRRAYGEEEEEGLEARIARLRREIEECKVLAQEEGGEDGEDEEEEEGEHIEEVDALSKMLAGIDIPSSSSTTTGGKRKSKRDQIFHDALPTSTEEDAEIDEQTLSKITAFDTRLAALETSLGLSSALDETLSTPLLPSLHLLDQQLSALTSATSLTTLEAAASRIHKLKIEAQHLAHLQNSPDHNETDDEGESPPAYLSPEDKKKLDSLYTLLPTLQSLTPTVPALINRMRSLRTLHTTAATASSDLDALEQRQTELDRELKMWREGLEKVERAVGEAQEANGKNGNMVKGWVEELQARMKGLGR